MAIGNGGITGTGNQKTNATLTSDTKYNGNGDATILVNADGSSASNNNKTSALDLTANGDLWNTNGLTQSKFKSENAIFSFRRNA